jgi:hypothetical protein
LRDLGIFAAVKLNNLRFPLAVVDCTISDFDFMTFPAGNVVEVGPFAFYIRLLEAPVDNNVLVLVGSVSLEYDVVNSKAVTIFDTRSLNL